MNNYEPGIKRDRLPWMGDLAISLMANAYTFRDEECVRGTLTVLGRCGMENIPSQPDSTSTRAASLATCHVNGIVGLFALVFHLSLAVPEILRRPMFSPPGMGMD